MALGIHKAIVSRFIALLKRIAPSGEVLFAGGVALNECVRSLIAEELKRPVIVPPDPQIVEPLGLPFKRPGITINGEDYMNRILEPLIDDQYTGEPPSSES